MPAVRRASGVPSLSASSSSFRTVPQLRKRFQTDSLRNFKQDGFEKKVPSWTTSLSLCFFLSFSPMHELAPFHKNIEVTETSVVLETERPTSRCRRSLALLIAQLVLTAQLTGMSRLFCLRSRYACEGDLRPPFCSLQNTFYCSPTRRSRRQRCSHTHPHASRVEDCSGRGCCAASRRPK